MRIIPAIDVIDGKCVRLTQGDYTQKKVYNENPLEIAKAFEGAGLKYLHLVDLDGAKAGGVTNWKVIEEITSKTLLTVDFGGGVKTEEEIQKLLDLGIAQINLGSIAVKRPYRVYEWMEKFGVDKIILSADVKDEQVKINGWQDDTAVDIESFIHGFHLQGLRHVTCTDISTDGMLTGPNIELYRKILSLFPNIKLIASGGVGSLQDVQLLDKTAVHGVIIGKAIYENRISLKDLANIESAKQ
jgi:phosphoribosylformimino-5-aminoimidazole carboxamide ribotide isomerase